MTVRELINALRAFPPGAIIAVAAHDHEPKNGEFDGFVKRVGLAPDAIIERGAGVVIYL